MLRNTFIHLPGIGPHRERAIWERGILDWEQFLAAAEKGSLPGRALDSAVPVVCRSLEAVAVGDPGFFKPLLPSREAWRLYPEFADRAVFLDIETTGLSGYYDEVTVIGALSRDGLALFVQDMNRLPLFSVVSGGGFPADKPTRAGRQPCGQAFFVS